MSEEEKSWIIGPDTSNVCRIELPNPSSVGTVRAMKRVVVLMAWLLPISIALGCEEAGGAREASAQESRSSGGESRMRRARRDMGLADPSRDRDEEGGQADELVFELGDERLPRMPHRVEPEGDLLREGLALAARALSMPAPVPESDLDRPGYQTFVEEDYARWVSSRAEALHQSRAALAPAEQGTTGEYAVVSAVIGLLFARFAEAIATMQIPSAIAEVTADRLRFRDAYLRAASPLFDRAADAFGACASVSARSSDSTLARWQRFCDEQLERLEDAPRPMD